MINHEKKSFPIKKQSKTFEYMMAKSRAMFRQEVLVWLTIEEIVKVALLSRKIYDSIDSNRLIFDHLKMDSEDYTPESTDVPAAIARRISSHFEQILKMHKMNGERLHDFELIQKCYTISDLKELRKKQNFMNHFDQAKEFCQISGLIPEQKAFLAKMW